LLATMGTRTSSTAPTAATSGSPASSGTASGTPSRCSVPYTGASATSRPAWWRTARKPLCQRSGGQEPGPPNHTATQTTGIETPTACASTSQPGTVGCSAAATTVVSTATSNGGTINRHPTTAVVARQCSASSRCTSGSPETGRDG